MSEQDLELSLWNEVDGYDGYSGICPDKDNARLKLDLVIRDLTRNAQRQFYRTAQTNSPRWLGGIYGQPYVRNLIEPTFVRMLWLCNCPHEQDFVGLNVAGSWQKALPEQLNPRPTAGPYL